MKQIAKIVGTPVTLLLVCFIAMCLSSLLPNQAIRSNVLESADQLIEEELYPSFLNFKLFQMDNYTDTIMLYECVTVDEDKPIVSIMSNRLYKSDDFYALASDMKQYVEEGTNGLEEMEYSRYWHGYLVILRPLLEFMNYHQIRVLNYVCFFLVFLALCVSINKFMGKKELFTFCIAQLAVALPLIPYNLQFSWTFYIAYIASTVLISREAKGKNNTLYIHLFLFVVGGITSFIDLLVTPIITIGLPLILLLMMRKEDGVKKKLSIIVTTSVSWALGYAFIWGSKWIIGGVITGTDVISDAINQMFIRTTGSTWKGMELTIPNIIQFVFSALAERHLLIPLVIFAVAAIVLYIVFAKEPKEIFYQCWLLLIACMTPVWFLVLREHSIQHGWFTWRAFMISIFAGLLFILNTCSFDAAREKIRRNREDG